MSRRSRSLVGVLATACVIGGAGTFALAQESAPTTQTTDQITDATAVMTTAVPAVQPDIADNFAVFRDQPATGMPAAVAAMVASPTRFGRNSALARAIKTPTGPGWVFPGDGFICVAVPDPVDGYGTTCLPTSVALVQGVSIALYGNLPGGRTAEVLVVPDGAQAVVTDDAGNDTPATVDDGVAAAWTTHPRALHLKH